MKVPYTTTVEARDTMIVRAAAKLTKIEPPVELTLAAAQKLLPEGFDLDQAEWDGILSNFVPDEATPAPGRMGGSMPDASDYSPAPKREAAPDVRADRANVRPPTATPKAKLDLDFNQSVEHLKELQRLLAEHRGEVMALSRLHQQKKGVLARAIEAWQSGSVVGDAETRRMNEVRDHLAATQVDRARRMEDIPAELRGKYGPAAAFVRKQRGVPPGVNPEALRKGQARGAAPAALRTLPGVRGQ